MYKPYLESTLGRGAVEIFKQKCSPVHSLSRLGPLIGDARVHSKPRKVSFASTTSGRTLLSKTNLISLLCSGLCFANTVYGKDRELEACYRVSADRLTGPLKNVLFSTDWVPLLCVVNLSAGVAHSTREDGVFSSDKLYFKSEQ